MAAAPYKAGGETPRPSAGSRDDKSAGFVRKLGLLDSTMIVAGPMIGSGIFIVSADIARQVGSSGGLLPVWLVTGLLTVAILLIVGLTYAGTRGIQLGELIQNAFTSTKTLVLLVLILFGILVGRNQEALTTNFSEVWTRRGAADRGRIHPK